MNFRCVHIVYGLNFVTEEISKKKRKQHFSEEKKYYVRDKKNKN